MKGNSEVKGCVISGQNIGIYRFCVEWVKGIDKSKGKGKGKCVISGLYIGIYRFCMLVASFKIYGDIFDLTENRSLL